jgi:type II restriction/modification system DNA methylase subunit YeeA
MNRTSIKNFAIWARRYLKEQVKSRAAQFGITQQKITEPQTVSGGLLVEGQTLNTIEANQYEQLRQHLADLMLTSQQAQAVEALIDEIAYTWFNRLAALRFMEVNGYIGRVLSSSDGNLVDPDILRDASSIAEMGDLPGFNWDILNHWRSLGDRQPNPDEFLYHRLLLVQCEALAAGIPALFDKRKNYQALFLPGNLLNQDSIIRRLVKEISEEDWENIEVVGWLYQFYISERKDEVIGAKSKVEAADIPAATQLFTPRWIVQYMVENSLGRLWLESHPESNLREKMLYFLENPHQDSSESGTPQNLTPEELTVIDPACGSGHILVYAFDLLLEIYREQGYAERDIPGLILTHNLYGLDIDERAAQLASFAVLMKARAINSRILRKPLALNIMAVRPTHGQTLPPANELNAEDWKPLIDAFKDADNLGSLITPPAFDVEKLKKQLDNLEVSDSLFREYVPNLKALVLQAELLSNKYWVVVANPPYMGSKNLNEVLRKFANINHPDSKSDAFSMFIERFLNMVLENGFIGLMTPFTWMFLSSYEKLRKRILSENTITSLIRPEYHAFFDSAYVPICSFILLNKPLPEYKGVFIDLNKFYGADLQPVKVLEAIKNPDCGYLYYAKSADFAKIPGSAIAYWMSNSMLEIFSKGNELKNIAAPRKGNTTTNNDRFIRLWYEVSLNKIAIYYPNVNLVNHNNKKWIPYNKGGGFRKWYGFNEYLINWENSGYEIKDIPHSVVANEKFFMQPGWTWSTVTSSVFSIRKFREGFIFDNGGCCLFSSEEISDILGGLLNSIVFFKIFVNLNPTLNFQSGDVARFSVIFPEQQLAPKVKNVVNECINLSQLDWDNFETSWDFQTHPLLRHNTKHLAEAFTNWQNQAEIAFRQLQHLEEENNRYWIEAYELQDELTPEVPDDQITIRRADLNRDIRSLISYAVGCILGRYSLDKPGLIHAGQPFDPSLHQTFPASNDAIIPITDQAYFDQDIITRFLQFLRIAYSPDTLTENLNFIANALTLKNGESPQERIRRYFLQEFISDHIQTYKKRPIYWLFTSGKKRAFSALVYLHRYNEDTLARLRTDYVLELQVKLDGEIARAQQQLDNSSSSTAKKSATKRLKELQDQQLELRDYQAKLQHLADARIKLDLDDGVAYNYTRFKGLVYEGSDLKMADLEKASQWKRDLR